MRGTYADPTANTAIANIMREERRKAREEARKAQREARKASAPSSVRKTGQK